MDNSLLNNKAQVFLNNTTLITDSSQLSEINVEQQCNIISRDCMKSLQNQSQQQFLKINELKDFVNCNQRYQMEIRTLQQLFLCFMMQNQNKLNLNIVLAETCMEGGLTSICCCIQFEVIQKYKKQCMSAQQLFDEDSSYCKFLDEFSLKRIPQVRKRVDSQKLIIFLKHFLDIQQRFYLVRTHLMIDMVRQNMANIRLHARKFYDIQIVSLGDDNYLLEFREKYFRFQPALTISKHKINKCQVLKKEFIQVKKIMILCLQEYQQDWLFSDQKFNSKLQLSLVNVQKYLKFDSKAYIYYLFNFKKQSDSAQLLKFVFAKGKEKNLIWNDINFSNSIVIIAQQMGQSNIFETKHLDDNYPKIKIVDQRQVDEKQSQRGIQYLQQIIKVLQKSNINSLKIYWDNGLLNYFKQLLENWQIYKNQLQLHIDFLIQLLDYKLAQFNLNFTSNAKQKVEFNRIKIGQNNIYQKLYPGIQGLVKQYLRKHKCEGFWQDFYSYAQKSNDKQILQARQNPTKQSRIQMLRPIGQMSDEQILQRYFKSFLTKKNNKLGIDSPNIIDSVLISYIQALTTGKTQGAICMKLQGKFKSLDKYIFQQLNFINGTSQWQDIFALLKRKCNQISKCSSFQKRQQYKMKEDYLANIQLERLVDARCLGCSQFFIYKMNILDDSINRVPVKVFPSISQLKQYQNQIKQEICAMLNGSGGVILFGCEMQNRQILVWGQKITERNKDQYEQRLQFMIRGFYPKVGYKINIQLTFVPVIQNPYLGYQKTPIFNSYAGQQSLLRTNQKYMVRQYMKGVYVARIRISPPNFYSTYVWEKQDGNQNKYFSAFSENLKTKQVKGRQLLKTIKTKFKNHWKGELETLSPLQKTLLMVNLDCFEGQCLQPQAGYKITQIDTPHHTVKEKNEDLYKYMSLIIIRSRNIPEFRRRLKAKNIICQVQQKFAHYKFKSAAGTAILYHNNSFDEILEIVCYNKQFQFDGKMTIAIFVTDYLRFGGLNEILYDFPLNYEGRINSQKWLNQQFPSQRLKYFSYETERGREYYAQTETKISTVFMFYLFNEFKFKSVLKSPLNLNQLQDGVKKVRWKNLIFPEDCQVQNQDLIEGDITKDSKKQLIF